MWISKKKFLRLNTRVIILEKQVERLLAIFEKEPDEHNPTDDYWFKKSSMNESGFGREE